MGSALRRGAAAPARLRRAGPGPLLGAGRALPLAMRAGQHDGGHADHAGQLLPPAALAGPVRPAQLGLRERYDLAPFFWTAQFGVEIRYSGHAKKWSAVKIDGSLKSKKCAVTFRRSGRTLAVATINRDLKSLEMERS